MGRSSYLQRLEFLGAIIKHGKVVRLLLLRSPDRGKHLNLISVRVGAKAPIGLQRHLEYLGPGIESPVQP